MNRFVVLSAALLVAGAGAALAAGESAARTAILDGYAAQAKSEAPSFAGFSADRGRALYLGPHSGGKAETNACAACHTPNPAAQGRHQKTGRAIEPMAVSANPKRFTDRTEIEKRFERDCPNVLGRACTAQEKGDFITYLAGQ
ncbi:DUF1924 domain-containing protein [Azospirillum sp. sgz302134]